MFRSWFRSLSRSSSASRRKVRPQTRGRFRPGLETLEGREVPTAGFLLSGFSSAVAGVAADVSVTAINTDGTTDTAYTGKVHFSSSDPQAILPSDASLVNGVGSFPVEFLTAGTQTLTATDTLDSTITGNLSSGSQAGPGFAQAPSASGGVVLSSWCDPNGSDADMYAYDNFILSSNQAINEVDWRGGYYYGAPYGKAWDFSITIFDSILGGSQPLVTNPQLPETYLAQYHVGGNAGETYVGAAGGIAMYDYHFVLPTAFQAVGGHTYWLRIEASQVGYPDWGVALSTAGNNQHFQFSTGAARFSYGGGDEAFTLKTTETVGVVVSPAATAQLVVSALPTTVAAGAVSEFVVTAQDAYGNLTPSYTGTVRFGSSDPQAVLPGDYYFSSTDQGRQTFTATLRTAGDQSLSATDRFNYSVAAGQAIATVYPAAAAGLTITGFPASTTVATAQAFTVSVVDAFGNVATNYTGTIHFNSGDPLASLPADYQFKAADAGIHAFSATLNTLGTQTLTAADTRNGAIAGSVFTAGQTAIFDFDTGTPAVHATMSMPGSQMFGGVTASFTSPNAWLSGGFSVQSHDTTFYNLSQFSGNYLWPNSVYNPNLAISFSQPLSSITFTYATADFGQNETPTTVQVTAYLGATVVGTASSHGVFYMGDTMPQGTLTFNGAGLTFDHVLIQIPPAPLAASDMLVDNIIVTTPNVAGIIVDPASTVSPVAPTLVVDNNVFTYDGWAYTATATAYGADGVTPVAGTYSFTYDGSTTQPTAAGTYAVVAMFTSADPNYTDATATGTLTISPAAPAASISGGPFTFDGTAHTASATALGVDGATSVAGGCAFTYNGSATLPTAAGTYTVVATFTSADPNYANATVIGAIIINAATPAFSNLTSPTIAAGTATVTLSGHLAAGSVLPSGNSVAITLNGVTQNALVDGSGNFSASFATGALPAGTYAVTFAFAGDGANFLAAPNGSGALTVTAVPTAPVVTFQPTSKTVVARSTVTFSAAATGNPTPAVQWQVSTNGGKTWKNIKGAKSTTLSFTASLTKNGYRYRAIFTNAFGQAITNAAILTVHK